MNTIAIIPARYASTRFPAKALAILAGKPIIQHVYERVVNSQLFSEVVIATDHPDIVSAVHAFKGQSVITSEHHLSGTDRIHEAAKHFPFAELILNVQGDEPLIDANSLADLIKAFNDPHVDMASLMTPITDPTMLNNPNIVKVVTDNKHNALYFSRFCLPYNRDNLSEAVFYRHIGVYAYTREALEIFVGFPIGRLENIEKLEQLRALENGMRIRMVKTMYQGIGIDTPEDLKQVEKAFFFNAGACCAHPEYVT